MDGEAKACASGALASGQTLVFAEDVEEPVRNGDALALLLVHVPDYAAWSAIGQWLSEETEKPSPMIQPLSRLLPMALLYAPQESLRLLPKQIQPNSLLRALMRT